MKKYWELTKPWKWLLFSFLVFGFSVWKKPRRFIWGSIYSCTMDGFFRIFKKAVSELICTRLYQICKSDLLFWAIWAFRTVMAVIKNFFNIVHILLLRENVLIFFLEKQIKGTDYRQIVVSALKGWLPREFKKYQFRT